VGPGNFLVAYHLYSDTQPFVAHNTLMQVASETGVISGVMYLLIFANSFMFYFRHRKYFVERNDAFMAAALDSATGSLLGFFSCALFLNLITYEVLYYVLVLSFTCQRIVASEKTEPSPSPQIATLPGNA
jgi:hypothetical protein